MSRYDVHYILGTVLSYIRKASIISLITLGLLFGIGLLINPDLTGAVAFIILILSIPSLITVVSGVFLIWIVYRITGD